MFGIEAEICQLAAIDEDGQHELTCYIMPERNITKYATDVNKLEILEIDGKRTLCHQGIPVKILTKSEALESFTNFLATNKSRCKTDDNIDKEIIPVLVGHNSSVFDVPIILLRIATPECLHALNELNIHFGGSLRLAKEILQEKPQHPALVASGEVCQVGLGSLYLALFGQSFPAHDALEDVRALQKVLFESFIGKLYDRNESKEIITKSMANKIAASGITYQDPLNLLRQAGPEGLIAVLKEQCHVSRIFSFPFFLPFYKLLMDSI